MDQHLCHPTTVCHWTRSLEGVPFELSSTFLTRPDVMTIWCTAVACERRTGCGSGVVLMKSHFPNNLVKVRWFNFILLDAGGVID
jgi:hypothetical protein